MKKIIILSTAIIIIPLLITSLITTKTEEYEYHFENNKIIRVLNEKTGSIDSILFEDYIMGVVSAEMPANFHIEALKAQAIASRSYAMNKIEENRDLDYDIVMSTTHQVYNNEAELKEKWNDKYDEYSNKIYEAINSTSGEYASYDGEVALTLFFSTSSGTTENCYEVFSENLPYLTSVESKWDSNISPAFSEVYNFNYEEFYQKLNIKADANLQIEVTDNTSTGNVKTVKINNINYDADDIRTKLNLRSTFFTINYDDKNIVITTKGYGHGVGMSQYGAYGMAKEGYTYDEIIKHYYQGVEIKNYNL